jgi:hypothetical protein
MNIKTIQENVHRLPGVGDVEYLYNRENKELTTL